MRRVKSNNVQLKCSIGMQPVTKLVMLASVALLCFGCTRDRSREPTLEDWVGQTVQLNQPQKVCISKASQESPWWDKAIARLLGSRTAYVMKDASVELVCRRDHFNLIGALPAGSSIKIVQFQTSLGWLGVEDNLRAILEVEIPGEPPRSLLVEKYLGVHNEETPAEFPWQLRDRTQ